MLVRKCNRYGGHNESTRKFINFPVGLDLIKSIFNYVPCITSKRVTSCKNYRGISLLSLPGKVLAKCREKKCRELVESKVEDGRCDFRPVRSTTDQIFSTKQIFDKSWEYGKDLFACFVNLKKVCD